MTERLREILDLKQINSYQGVIGINKKLSLLKHCSKRSIDNYSLSRSSIGPNKQNFHMLTSYFSSLPPTHGLILQRQKYFKLTSYETGVFFDHFIILQWSWSKL